MAHGVAPQSEAKGLRLQGKSALETLRRHAGWRHPSTLRCQSLLAWKNCTMLLHPPLSMLAGSRAEALFFGSSFAWSSSDLGNTEAACGTALEVPTPAVTDLHTAKFIRTQQMLELVAYLRLQQERHQVIAGFFVGL